MAAPIGHTCPDIDRAIASIKEALDTASDFNGNFESKTIDDIKDAFGDIENSLVHMESEMEDLRNNNSSLRDWGDGLETKIIELEEEIDEVREKLESKE